MQPKNDGLQKCLHNSVTESETQKSKLDLDKMVLRQKLDVMSSRNEILNNEEIRLEKLVTMKNDDAVELENKNRGVKRKTDQLQMEVLWKPHASRADDSLLIGTTESSPVITSDSEGSTPNNRKTYSSAATSGIDVTQHSATLTSDQQRSSAADSATYSSAAQAGARSNESSASPTSENQPLSTAVPASDSGLQDTQPKASGENGVRNEKEMVLLIGTSNVRYLSSRYIAGEKYYVHNVIKYTVAEAKEYIESLEKSDKVFEFLLHLSCNDIKSVSVKEHATAYSDLAKMVKEKYPIAQVIVSLGLLRQDPTINNKIEIFNGMI